MDNSEKKQWVKDYLESMIRCIKEDIDSGKIPDAWNGYELKKLVEWQCKKTWLTKDKDRDKKFMNVVRINNL